MLDIVIPIEENIMKQYWMPIRFIMLLVLLSLSACQTLVGYKPGYDRSSFGKWVTKRFDKMGVEIALPEHHRIKTNKEKYVDIDLHTFYPDDMFVEWTTIYSINITKLSRNEYEHPKYYQKHVNAPAFYANAQYFKEKEENMRLRTDIVYIISRHIKDDKDNIYNIEIRIYPWRENEASWLDEDIDAGFKIANSLKL
jgi:hypothetical protein